jgi:hypothetical protein
MDKIGRYRIVGKLGTGGFGTVYQANDPGMGRVVAIKVLNAQDDAELVKRFKAEARMAAKLHHPNIVTVFDFGEENGKLYLVMEYLDGVTLGGLIAGETQLSTVEKLQILCDAAQGLKAAHEQGIVHRDVKPANIMRVADGSVKIMDFGISRAMASVDTRLTQTGVMIGTPAYMAPEQFNEGVTDVLSDIWGYGVLMYEFLTGTNPFHAPTPAQVIYRLTMDEPPALSRSLTGLPERLEGVVNRLLSKERNRRYQTMEDVCFDLEAILLEIRQPEIDELIASADELIRGVHLDEALDKVRRILELDRANAWARKRRGDIQEMVRVRSVQARLQELLDQAGAEILAGNDTAGDALLEEALKLDPTNGEVRKRIDEIQVARARAKRSANLLSSTRDELGRALELASQAAESDPGNAEARKLADAIRLAFQGSDLEPPGNEVLSVVDPVHEPTDEVTRSTKTPPAVSEPPFWLVIYSLATLLALIAVIFIVANGKKASPMTALPPKKQVARDPDSTSEGFYKAVRTLTAKNVKNVNHLVFSPDGKFLYSDVTTSSRGTEIENGELHLWDVTSGTLARSVHQASWSLAADLDPDGKHYVTGQGGSENLLRVWDAKTLGLIYTSKVLNETPKSLQFSPDGQFLAVSDDRIATIFDARTFATRYEIHPFNGLLSCISFSRDGQRLLTSGYVTAPAGHSGLAKLWDIATQRELWEIKGVRWGVGFTPDGRWVVAEGGHRFSDKNDLTVWDANSGAFARSFGGRASLGYRFSMSPDGRLILTCAEARLLACMGRATLRDFQTGATIQELTELGGWAAPAFSRDGIQMAYGTKDGSIQLLVKVHR